MVRELSPIDPLEDAVLPTRERARAGVPAALGFGVDDEDILDAIG